VKIAKSVFNFLPFIAIIFAALYFHHIDTRLDICLSDVRILFLSFILLIAVFISQAVIWRILLLRFNINVSFNIAFASQFRSILMKYIPGKIWAIVGRANIVSQHGYSLKYCSFVSVLMQIVSIISGLMIGVVGMLYCGFFFLPPFVSYTVLAFLIICMVILSREILIPEIIIKFLPKKFHQFVNQRIPPITDIILLCGIHWILMG